MFQVTRNLDGSIQSVSKDTQGGGEVLPSNHPDVVAFFEGGGGQTPGFDAADAEFVRVLEDLIDTLILKNVIYHTDLPAAAQKKLLARKGLRSRLQGALTLLGNDDRLI
ncbi:MAG: hypothetical protein U1E84_13410 [Rhodoferax sp.]